MIPLSRGRVRLKSRKGSVVSGGGREKGGQGEREGTRSTAKGGGGKSRRGFGKAGNENLWGGGEKPELTEDAGSGGRDFLFLTWWMSCGRAGQHVGKTVGEGDRAETSIHGNVSGRNSRSGLSCHPAIE